VTCNGSLDEIKKNWDDLITGTEVFQTKMSWSNYDSVFRSTAAALTLCLLQRNCNCLLRVISHRQPCRAWYELLTRSNVVANNYLSKISISLENAAKSLNTARNLSEDVRTFRRLKRRLMHLTGKCNFMPLGIFKTLSDCHVSLDVTLVTACNDF